MNSLLGEARKVFKFSKVNIDNWVFVLHSKISVALHVLFVTFLGARQYFGDPIRCATTSPNQVAEKLLDDYCWITGTFTVHEYGSDQFLVDTGSLNPGIGPFVKSDHTKVHHRYYQWVPTTLIFVACFFYLPRLIWKCLEGGRMAAICQNMDKEVDDDSELVQRAQQIKKHFQFNRQKNTIYGLCFVACQVLNLINVLFLFWATNAVLENSFFVYGDKLLKYFNSDIFLDSAKPLINPMDSVFPKVTKCTFQLFGPSGTHENIDGMCTLPLNIVTEKVYVILWFWYLCLAVITFLDVIVWSFCIVSTHIRSRLMINWVSSVRKGETPIQCVRKTLGGKLSFGDWFVIKQIGKNIESQTYDQFLCTLMETADTVEDDQLKPSATFKESNICNDLIEIQGRPVKTPLAQMKHQFPSPPGSYAGPPYDNHSNVV